MKTIDKYVKRFYGVKELSAAQHDVKITLIAAYSPETLSQTAIRLKMAKAALCAAIKRVHRLHMDDLRSIEGMITFS